MSEINEDQFNADMRKFLKTFGVTAQREIEKAVRKAVDSGQLADASSVTARARLEVEGTDVNLVIEEPLRIK
ncbi:MAG TPA: DUF6494 family protein [Roseiflexaceae bacterium]|nr:DUF6494 family protein [Roseiflexaceae bacterium]